MDQEQTEVAASQEATRPQFIDHGEAWCPVCSWQKVLREYQQRDGRFRLFLACGHSRLAILIPTSHKGMQWVAPPPTHIESVIIDPDGREYPKDGPPIEGTPASRRAAMHVVNSSPRAASQRPTQSSMFGEP